MSIHPPYKQGNAKTQTRSAEGCGPSGTPLPVMCIGISRKARGKKKVWGGRTRSRKGGLEAKRERTRTNMIKTRCSYQKSHGTMAVKHTHHLKWPSNKYGKQTTGSHNTPHRPREPRRKQGAKKRGINTKMALAPSSSCRAPRDHRNEALRTPTQQLRHNPHSPALWFSGLRASRTGPRNDSAGNPRNQTYGGWCGV